MNLKVLNLFMLQVILDVWHGVELGKRIRPLKNWCSWNLNGQGSANTEPFDGGGSFFESGETQREQKSSGLQVYRAVLNSQPNKVRKLVEFFFVVLFMANSSVTMVASNK